MKWGGAISGILWLPFPAFIHILYDYILYCIFWIPFAFEFFFIRFLLQEINASFLCFRIFCYSLHWFEQVDGEEKKITESQIHNHFGMEIKIKQIIIILMTWEWFEWIDCLALEACSVKKYWSLNEVINSSRWEIDRNRKTKALKASETAHKPF